MSQLGPNIRSLMRRKISLCLIVVQMAFATALVSNLSFSSHQLMRLSTFPVGIEIEPLMTVFLRPTNAQGSSYQQVRRDLARLTQIADVAAVAAVRWAPLSHQSTPYEISHQANPQAAKTKLHSARVSPEILTTLNLPLILGRDLTAADMPQGTEAVKSIIVSQAAAKALFTSPENALDKIIYHNNRPVQIVGITQDWGGFSFDFKGTAELTVFEPGFDEISSEWRYIIRSRTPSPTPELKNAIRASLEAVHTSGLLLEFELLPQLYTDTFGTLKVYAGLMVVFLIFLCCIVVITIAGQSLFWVNQQRKNLGIRRALGASRWQIIGLILQQNILMALPGIGIGVGLALGLNRLICSVAVDFPAMSPAYLSITLLALLALILASAAGPAWRASLVPPSLATRSQ
ncbi:MAG: hypothetical protein RL497_2494 [Pseudomonadota bacterium]|jgi:putative ABC transport system permease protein